MEVIVTTIQQVVFELEIDYLGHPYYVSGNAILHAIAPHVEYETQRHLRVSHGVFAPGQFGKFPDGHSQDGTRPGMGSSLPDVERYSDLFLCRCPEHAWLLDSRPRDLLNVPDVRVQSGKPGIQPETIINLPDEHRHDTSSTTWYVHAYLHADTGGVLPLDEPTLDGLQFGGKRNYGYGTTRLKDTQTVDLDALSYERVANADDLLLRLVTPYVVDSEVPHADANSPPWWWQYDGSLRRRREQIVEQRDEYALQTIDYGQVVRYCGDDPVATARNGVTRVGSHSKYGFGEFRLIPV